jgi:hypothetical protein
MMTKEQCAAEKNDVEWLKNPSFWAGDGMMCPVKKRDYFTNPKSLGVVFSDQGSKVFLGNMFLGDIDFDNPIAYETFEALVADGWEVD